MKFHLVAFVLLAGSLAPPSAFGQNDEEGEKAVKVILHPMPEPKPALKYKLLPPFLERRPGNAAVWWNRIPAAETRYFTDMWKEGGNWETIEKWMEIPLGDPREKDFRGKEPTISDSLRDSQLFRDMARAAQFESCDWQLPAREGNIIMMLLPEVNQLRNYSRLLAAKARLEIAERHYSRAVELIQTDFALARHVTAGQSLVHGLVGIATASQMTDQIEQFIQQPDAPNLYWAMSTLPRPLVDLGPAFEEESNFLVLQFPELKDIEKQEHSPEEWRKLLETTVGGFRGIVGLAGVAENDEKRLRLSSLLMSGMAVQGYPVAKRYLIEHGHPAATVEAMAVAQALLIASVEYYQEVADDYFKSLFLPYAEGDKYTRQADKRLKEITAGRREVIPIASIFLPATGMVKAAEAKLQWILARLRILEALRIYAAAHAGKLPDKLDDITEVLVPRNPFDDKPFSYHRDGDHATLFCEHGPSNVPLRYDITMLPQGEK